MNHINKELDSMDVISNKSENGNEDPKWIIEFTNLFVAITLVQWLSILSNCLNNLVWVGWILTASFAFIYIALLILIREASQDTPIYFSLWRVHRNYNVCWLGGVIPLLLFFPIKYWSSEVLNWQFTLCVVVAVCFWMLVTGVVIPSLLGMEHNKRRGAICG